MTAAHVLDENDRLRAGVLDSDPLDGCEPYDVTQGERLLRLRRELDKATKAQDWPEVGRLAVELTRATNSQSDTNTHLLDGPAMAEPLPPLSYFVRELALVDGPGAPHLDAGYGYSLKTFSEQDKLLALATGGLVWNAYPVGNPRRVIHVDLEQGARLTTRRYQRLAAARGVSLASLGDRLVVAAMPRLKLTEQDADSWKRLMDGRSLMLVDSLRAATPGADENSSEIRSSLDMLGALSEETGCRALVIHHARKPPPGERNTGGRYSIRGSSAIYDGCDAVYVFSAEESEPVAVKCVKARSHGEEPEALCLVIEDVEIDGDRKGGVRISARGIELLQESRQASQRVKDEKEAHVNSHKVLEAIRDQPGISTTDLRSATGLNGARLAAAKKVLGKRITVKKGAEGVATAYCHYLGKLDREAAE